MATLPGSALPTYTLPLVDRLIAPDRPPELVPSTIAVSIALFCIATCVAGICFYGNLKRGIIFRKDIDDAEVAPEPEIILTPPSVVHATAPTHYERRDTAYTLSPNHPTDYERRDTAYTLSPDDSVSAVMPRSYEHRPPQRSAQKYSAFLHPQNHSRESYRISGITPRRGTSYIPDDASESSENSRNIGYGNFGPDARSTLDVGSGWEGSVRFSRIVDRKVPGDSY